MTSGASEAQKGTIMKVEIETKTWVMCSDCNGRVGTIDHLKPGDHAGPWYCDDCGKETVAAEGEPSRCEHCGGEHIRQDPDTLDTWFSSGSWTFSTLGWPEDTADMKTYQISEFYEISGITFLS